MTAVIVEIPEAVAAVGSWRARFDTSAAARSVAPLLPVSATVRTMMLLGFDGTSWRPRATFPLGSGRA